MLKTLYTALYCQIESANFGLSVVELFDKVQRLQFVLESAIVLFFFQAEDGIRDHCLTGVQTCALPISSMPRRVSADMPHERVDIDGAINRWNVVSVDPTIRPQRCNAAGDSRVDAEDGSAAAHEDRKSVV